MFRLAMISAAAILALSCSASAGVNDMKTSRVMVAVNDLNLNRASDAQTAFRRIERAAATACGGNPLARTWHGQPIGPLLRQYRLCQEEAIARTVAQLQLPIVVSAYVSKHHHTTEQWADEYRR